ncbi:MAG: hypothetical protein K0R69_2438 [Clostridia bacterium]|jgi:hypothetical protein|nr:hypothetical protein [Clostridia bacterium]
MYQNDTPIENPFLIPYYVALTSYNIKLESISVSHPRHLYSLVLGLYQNDTNPLIFPLFFKANAILF